MQLENIQQFVLVLLYGGLTLLSFTVLINPMQVNKKANFYFGVFILLWSSYWLLDILHFCGIVPNLWFILTLYAAQIFTPIFLFFSVIFFINPNYRFQKKDLICLITPVIYWILLFNMENNPIIRSTVMLIDIAHNLPYIALIYFKIRKHQKRIETISSNTENIDLQWLIRLSFLLFVTIVITVGYELFNTFVYKMHQHLVMDLLFLFIVYSTLYYVLRQKEIYPVNKNQREELLSIEVESEVEETSRKKLISDDEFESLRQQLIIIMETQKPYLDGDLNLLKLSDLIQINAHQLSYLLNTGFQENFFYFVNKYRVEHAKKMLTEGSFHKLSILGIAFESGFNSKTAFNTIFKKMTGMTPSEFKKEQSS
ncbi:DNA-binding transcriptional regulator AraC [Chryseobacterium nakagawai]|uniref:AraC family transcriptional regulator n=1 Tax=Chryseobacterium nakagawai TaxID=1241982 RepID=A0AAD0YM79_CHRNA|nr:helix-turn-helix domain-containing protein [Chryseobacterium nakagawai]AZA91003.1 AraC family transcriptional regulator [Chryseobacterium nakagawai]VEH22551.1 DNA-binding transcriptional regulator AraC [Chryseobacterium nakagawai]